MSGKWLEISAAYQKQIRQFRVELKQIESEETDLSFDRSADILDRCQKKKEILTSINQCQLAYKQLGLRLGEDIDPNWLKVLEPIEKEVFLLRYEDRLTYDEIKQILGTRKKENKRNFEKALQKIFNLLSGQHQ